MQKRNSVWERLLLLFITSLALGFAATGCIPADTPPGESGDDDDDNDNNDDNNNDNDNNNDDNNDDDNNDDDNNDDDNNDNDDNSTDSSGDGDTDSDSDSDGDTETNLDTDTQDTDTEPDTELIPACDILGDLPVTVPTESGTVKIPGQGTFSFEPSEVVTFRPDIFQEGYFSVFDAVVHVCEKEGIEISYAYDDQRETYLIDSIAGKTSWWYKARHHNSVMEPNVNRMDYYPVKDQTDIELYNIDSQSLEIRLRDFKTEVERKKANGGKMIIPEIWVRYYTSDPYEVIATNVEVKPHNLRVEFLKGAVITTMDVLMSLWEQQIITTCTMEYQNVVGNANIFDYWVTEIDGRAASGRCGYVVEPGEINTQGEGNQIHVSPDIRPIYSPEYVYFKWVELGPC